MCMNLCKGLFILRGWRVHYDRSRMCWAYGGVKESDDGGYEMQKFYLNFLFRPCKTANWSSFLNKYFKKNLHCAAGVWFLSQEQNHPNPQEKLGSVVFLTRPCYSHHKVCEEPGTSHRVPLWGANCMRNISRHSWYLATWGTTHTEGKQVFHSKDHLSGYIFYCG